jgi:hypothetical protein
MWRVEAFVVVIAVAAAACNRPPAKMLVSPVGELSRAVIDPYLSADAALASDRIEGVLTNAVDISAAARVLGPSARAIDAAAVQLASAKDVGEARQHFGTLSEAIDSYMANQHLVPPAGVRVAFCPMAMRPWLQRDGAIRNPYYGSQMLTCGSFRN